MKNLAAKIIELYKAGKSGHTISREFDLSPMQVYHILKKNGVACRKQGDALRRWWSKHRSKDFAVKNKEALELLAQGMRPTDIAEKLNVCSATITNWKRKAVTA